MISFIARTYESVLRWTIACVDGKSPVVQITANGSMLKLRTSSGKVLESLHVSRMPNAKVLELTLVKF